MVSHLLDEQPPTQITSKRPNPKSRFVAHYEGNHRSEEVFQCYDEKFDGKRIFQGKLEMEGLIDKFLTSVGATEFVSRVYMQYLCLGYVVFVSNS